MKNFDKLLLTELRTIQSPNIKKCNDPFMRENNFTLAFIDLDNLRALGYDLRLEDVLKLAGVYSEYPDIKPLYKQVAEMDPSIEVSPMYPNFPKQVLEMSELEFRIDQMNHYMSTYGLEEAFGIEVKKGWLPKTTEVISREKDKQLLELKTLDYLTAEEIDLKVIGSLIGRKQRLEEKELEIAKEVVMRTSLEIEDVPFKENIGNLFGNMILNGSKDEKNKALTIISKITRHTGDVLDLAEQMIVLNKYKHFSTSTKRALVNLIENFSKQSIEENLAGNRWSNKFLGEKGKSRCKNRNISIIDYLSYNRFSKDKDAKTIVDKLKSGKLLSWNQKLEIEYEAENYKNVLSLLNQRPGIYFRQINRLIKLGVDKEVISADLKKAAEKLKTQSIISSLNNFTGNDEVDKVFFDVLISNLMSKNVEELKNKKVFIDENEVDFSKSKLEITDKFAEGGYIQNGMAIKIPKDVKIIRFFTYWNDNQRIDIDLHGVSIDDRENVSHIGWHGSRHANGIVHSGDITHSNAAEYIDIDIEKAILNKTQRVQLNINSYTGAKFSNIQTVFTGLMAVSELSETVELYDSKNVLFKHDLNGNYMAINYGMIDLKSRTLFIIGKESNKHNDTDLFDIVNHKLTINTYLNLLLATQGCEIVKERDEADVILGLGKSDEQNYVSLVDVNFFM